MSRRQRTAMRFSPLRMPYGELNCLDKNLVFVFALVAVRRPRRGTRRSFPRRAATSWRVARPTGGRGRQARLRDRPLISVNDEDELSVSVQEGWYFLDLAPVRKAIAEWMKSLENLPANSRQD